MPKLIKFADQSPEAIRQDTSAVTISGAPGHTVWVHFKGADDTVRAGIWESTAGVFRGPQNNQIEYCYILEGGATIRTQDGAEFDVTAGDGFVMDNGLQPVWTVPDRVKKQWVIVSVPTQ
ncbi:cupin domain-containing protein [Sulfitobacter sp. S190]|uniref:cupin domain-containing protein n=1 Tax=Sulfitobacter sp. S190 TaxID=2867022 RepID=UPI0021A5DADD|nr:cupin domain-containing protein [Sulfitobacter sp. S190]UWR23016.1 cupin domain-containing protein [Sulfitobacter sp. S190]